MEPGYVFAPDSVSVLVPCLVMPASLLPLITPLNVVSVSGPEAWSSPVVSLAVPRAILPAPAIDPTVSLKLARLNVAPKATDTADRSGITPAAPEVNVPVEIVVAPV